VSLFCDYWDTKGNVKDTFSEKVRLLHLSVQQEKQILKWCSVSEETVPMVCCQTAACIALPFPAFHTPHPIHRLRFSHFNYVRQVETMKLLTMQLPPASCYFHFTYMDICLCMCVRMHVCNVCIMYVCM